MFQLYSKNFSTDFTLYRHFSGSPCTEDYFRTLLPQWGPLQALYITILIMIYIILTIFNTKQLLILQNTTGDNLHSNLICLRKTIFSLKVNLSKNEDGFKIWVSQFQKTKVMARGTQASKV